ncbi:MAG: PQQ-binding-like beta-propeller repeat protein, partial [Pirellulales bacterium]
MSPIRTAVALSVVLLGLSTSLPAADGDKKLDAREQTATVNSQVDPLDWPSWRGPEQNGISRETGLIDSWDPRRGTNVVWKKPELATRSTPIVMHGKLYVLCRHEPDTPRDAEKLVCADAATGEILWENVFNVFLSDVPPERVGWSNCAGDPTTGRVYALGVCGLFLCIDGETGQTIWSRSLSEEFGLLSTYGGRTNTPVIFEDLVIISAVMTNWGELALPAHRFLAFNKNTGEVVWFNGTRLRPDDTTYSTPALAVLAGQAAMVFGSGDGAVWAFQPRTGVPIWSYRLSIRGLNVSPIVEGDTVYMAQSEENRDGNTMGAFVAIDGSKAGDVTESGELWRVKQVMVGKSSPLLVDGRLYALDDANVVYIIDPATGKQIGRTRLTGTITRASPVYADGKIYACTTTVWHVLEPAERGAEVVHRQRFPQGEEVHGSPIVSHGRIYLPTTGNMYCLGSDDAQTAA